MKQITVEELEALLANKPSDVIVVDVRTEEERKDAHIEGTIHIPLNQIPEHIDELKKAKAIYFQCAKGGRSAIACDILEKSDFQNVFNVAGGIEAWKAKGFETI